MSRCAETDWPLPSLARVLATFCAHGLDLEALHITAGAGAADVVVTDSDAGLSKRERQQAGCSALWRCAAHSSVPLRVTCNHFGAGARPTTSLVLMAACAQPLFAPAFRCSSARSRTKPAYETPSEWLGQTEAGVMAGCRISISPCSLAAHSPSRSSALARAANGKQSGIPVGFRMKIASQPFSSSLCWQRSSPALV
jgi:hypothetical protein